MIGNFWDVPAHHRYHSVELLVKETARRLKVDPKELEVFINSFVRLANDHLEEVIGFHSAPARRACSALSDFLSVKKVCTSTMFDLGTGECLDCGKQHHPAGAALVSD